LRGYGPVQEQENSECCKYTNGVIIIRVMALGCESEGLGFKPQQLQTTFDPGLAKKPTKIFPALQCAFND